MAWDKAKASGKEVLVILINMKDSTNKIKNKDMVFLFGKMEMFTKEIFWTIYEVVMDKCIGLTEEFIKVNGLITSK